MKSRIAFSASCFVVFLLMYCAATAQGFLSMKRNNVKKQLTRFYSKQQVPYRFAETDSSITVIVTDTSGKHTAGFSYFFKRNNRCYKETGDGACEHCFQKIISDAKMVKRYRWKTVSEQFYLSKPLWNMVLMRTDPERPFSYSIIKDYFNRTDHKKLYKIKL